MHVPARAFAVTLVFLLSHATRAQVARTLISPTPSEDGHFGHSVSGAGDVNADGINDVIVGAPREEVPPFGEAGKAHAFDGATGTLLYSWVGSLADPWTQLGWSVSGAGDVDSDGHADLLIGAPFWGDWHNGQAYVCSGQNGGCMYVLDPSEPFEFEIFGWSVSEAGDLSGDGHDDVLVGAHGDYGSAGSTYVFCGETGGLLAGLISPNAEYNGRFGFSVSGGGFVDDDGVPDIVVGAFWEDPGASPTDAGRAYVFSGQTWGVLHTLVSPNEEQRGQFGCSVSHVGDLDDDGRGEVIVGAPYEDGAGGASDAGRAYVFGGQTGTVLYALTSPMELASGTFGWAVSGAGDANGDGCPDMLVGAPGEDSGSGAAGSGAAYVFSGNTGDLLHVLCSAAPVPGGEFGCSVSDVGDLDGDGLDEVVVGAPGEPGLYPAGAGRAYVFAFPPTMALTGALVGGSVVRLCRRHGVLGLRGRQRRLLRTWVGSAVSTPLGDTSGGGAHVVQCGGCRRHGSQLDLPGTRGQRLGRGHVFL
jgi:hypothetical protein